jgi:hypothetical protein
MMRITKKPFKERHKKKSKFGLPPKFVELRFNNNYIKDWYITPVNHIISGDIWNGNEWCWYDVIIINSINETKYGPDKSHIVWTVTLNKIISRNINTQRNISKKERIEFMLHPNDINKMFDDQNDTIIGRANDKVNKLKK